MKKYLNYFEYILKFIVPFISLMGFLYYLMGVTYHQSYLNYFNLSKNQFPESFNELIRSGYFVLLSIELPSTAFVSFFLNFFILFSYLFIFIIGPIMYGNYKEKLNYSKLIGKVKLPAWIFKYLENTLDFYEKIKAFRKLFTYVFIVLMIFILGNALFVYPIQFASRKGKEAASAVLNDLIHNKKISKKNYCEVYNNNGELKHKGVSLFSSENLYAVYSEGSLLVLPASDFTLKLKLSNK